MVDVVNVRFAEHVAERGHNVVVLHSVMNHDAKMPKLKKVINRIYFRIKISNRSFFTSRN